MAQPLFQQGAWQDEADRPTKRRRNRGKVSCLPCQKKKLRCDLDTLNGKEQCEGCARRNDKCIWPPPVMAGPVRDDVENAFNSIHARLATLESQMAQCRESPEPPVHVPSPHRTCSSSSFSTPDEESSISETEAAAQALEKIALGARQYSPFLGLNASIPPGAAEVEPGAYTSIFSSDPSLRTSSRPFWLDSLPDKIVCDTLVAYFFDTLHFVFCVIHRPTFLLEYNQLWTAVRNCTVHSIDMAWLASLFWLLHASVCNLNPSALPPTLYHLSDSITQLRRSCMTTADACLSSSCWQDNPSIRSIQAVIFKAGLGPGSGAVTGSGYFVLIASAIRICQLLGLHRLGDDPKVMPKDDAALPRAACVLKREVAKRVWWYCVALDGIFSTSEGMGLVYLERGPDETSLPLNVNDDDLGLTLTWPQHGPSYVSDYSFMLTLIELAKFCHAAIELSQQPLSTVGYDRVLFLNTKIQHLIQRVETGSLGIDERLPHYYKTILLAILHHRVIQLHRPYFLRAASSPGSSPIFAQTINGAAGCQNYFPSVTASLQSAASVADAFSSIHPVANSPTTWHAPGFGIAAVLVLWVAITRKEREQRETSQERSLILKIREFYAAADQATKGNVQLQGVIPSHTCKIIDYLLELQRSPFDQHTANTFRLAAQTLQGVNVNSRYFNDHVAVQEVFQVAEAHMGSFDQFERGVNGLNTWDFGEGHDGAAWDT